MRVLREGVAAAHEELDTDAEGRHRLQGLGIDIALLPINEDRPAGGRNLNGAEAADLALSIGVQIAIPCHYEMFELNTASPTSFEEQIGPWVGEVLDVHYYDGNRGPPWHLADEVERTPSAPAAA